MILNPDFGVHASRPDGAQALCRAVLVRAVLDPFGKAIPASEGDDAQLARREALYFLTRERGAWAESRSRLCGACGIDPDALRLNILRIPKAARLSGRMPAMPSAAAQRTKQVAKRQALPRRIKPSYSAARSAVLPLLSELRQFKEGKGRLSGLPFLLCEREGVHTCLTTRTAS